MKLQNIVLLIGPAILSRLNQASRISRLLSGINPWSGSSEGDVPCDLTFIPTADPTVVSICRDAKLKIWSAQVRLHSNASSGSPRIALIASVA